MNKSEIKPGSFYDVEDKRLYWGKLRAEVLGQEQSGGWKVRLLDPPYVGHERTVTSRQIVRHWLSPAERLRHSEVRVSGGADRQAHHDRLSELAASLAEAVEVLEPTHPVAIGHISLPSSLAEQGAPGEISLTLPEPAAKALLSALREAGPAPADALSELI